MRIHFILTRLVISLLYLLWTIFDFTSAVDDTCIKINASKIHAIDCVLWSVINDGHYGQFITNDGNYELRNAFKINFLSNQSSCNDAMALRIGFYDSTTYIRKSDTAKDYFNLRVKIDTDAELYTGIITFTKECSLNTSYIMACRSQLYFSTNDRFPTPMYKYSPTNVEFWNHHKDEYMLAPNWITRLYIGSYGDTNIPSSWISELQLNSLEYLEITGNKWGRLDALLSSLPSLKTLDLSDNNIEELPEDLFVNTPGLRNLTLTSNNLSVFPKGLDTLQNLELIDINNPVGYGELDISNAALMSIKRLRVIDFGNVHLNTNLTTLLSLQNVSYLNVSGCGLIYEGGNAIESESTEVQNSLMVLDMSRNNLTYLYGHIFSSFKKLEKLFLQNNELYTCPFYAFNELFELVHLDLSKNIISEISSLCFYHLFKIEHINLSNNEIAQLPYDTFQHSLHLQILDLSNNKLFTIHSSTFIGLLKLRHLNLSNNFLISEIYLDAVSVDHLDISGNSLLSLTHMTEFESSIDYLDVSRNMILEWSISSVKHLNISYNGLTVISENMAHHFNNAKTIDLGGNPFNCCSENFTVLKDWIKNTPARILKLGKRNALKCTSSRGSLEYDIHSFVYRKELCRESQNIVVEDYDKANASNRSPYYIVTIAQSVVIIILIITLLCVMYVYNRPSQEQPQSEDGVCTTLSLSKLPQTPMYMKNLSFEYDDGLCTE